MNNESRWPLDDQTGISRVIQSMDINDIQILMEDPGLTLTLSTIPHHKLWCVRVADKQGRTTGFANSENPKDAIEVACLQAKNHLKTYNQESG